MNLVALLPQLEQDFLTKDSFGEYDISYGSSALTRLARLFAEGLPTPQDINEFLAHINLRYEAGKRVALAERFALFLPELLDTFFVMPLWSEDSEEHSEDAVTNTFVGYWTLLSHLNQFTNYMPDNVGRRDVLMRFLKKTRPYALNLAYQDLDDTNLSYFEAENPNFSCASLKRASLLYARMPKAVFDNACLQHAQMSNAYLPEGSWVGADLMKTQLLEAELTKGIWHKANLLYADFTQARLANSYLDYSNLQGADFTLADLSGCSIFQSDMRFVNFTKANLAYTKITGADMRDTNLYRANLQHAEIMESILQPQNLEKADFRNAVLGERNQEFLQKQGAIV